MSCIVRNFRLKVHQTNMNIYMVLISMLFSFVLYSANNDFVKLINGFFKGFDIGIITHFSLLLPNIKVFGLEATSSIFTAIGIRCSDCTYQILHAFDIPLRLGKKNCGKSFLKSNRGRGMECH